MFQSTLAPFPIAYSVAGFLFGAVLAGLALLLRRTSNSNTDQRHSPDAWRRAGVFGQPWTRVRDGSSGFAFTVMLLLAAGLLGGALPRLLNSLLDRSEGARQMLEIVDVQTARPKNLPRQHIAIVDSPTQPGRPLRIPILQPDRDVVGDCIGLQVHPGFLNEAWFVPDARPGPCPDQGSSSELSP